jgi:hypothetical protein
MLHKISRISDCVSSGVPFKAENFLIWAANSISGTLLNGLWYLKLPRLSLIIAFSFNERLSRNIPFVYIFALNVMLLTSTTLCYGHTMKSRVLILSVNILF